MALSCNKILVCIVYLPDWSTKIIKVNEINSFIFRPGRFRKLAQQHGMSWILEKAQFLSISLLCIVLSVMS